MRNLYINIRKPLRGTNYVGINESLLLKAIKLGVKLDIEVPSGVGTVDPEKWMRTGERQAKIFLRPDEPMILFYNYVPYVPKDSKIPVKGRVTTTKVTTIVIEETQTKMF